MDPYRLIGIEHGRPGWYSCQIIFQNGFITLTIALGLIMDIIDRVEVYGILGICIEGGQYAGNNDQELSWSFHWANLI
jgi:hypothetical protein